MQSKFCGDRRPHSPHPWRRQRKPLMCMGEGMAVESKITRARALLIEVLEDTACRRGLDDLHEEYYQLTKDEPPWWAGSYITYTPSWSMGYGYSSHTYSKPKSPEQLRREELEGLLHDCLYMGPRCRWKHDDSNDDV